MNFVLKRAKLIRRGTALLLGGLACSSITDPPLDARAVAMQPLPVYARWWSMVESCSGLQGSLSAVSWYDVPGSATVEYPGDEVSGYWSAASNRIVLAGTVTLSGDVVRHEMLHALLRNVKGHPREYFLDRCAGVVSCASSCVKDAGPGPNVDVTTTERVTADVLKLFVSVVPASPSSSVDGGVFTVIVTATNPNSHPIFVTAASLLNQSFFCTLFRDAGDGIAATVDVLDSSGRYFAAGETKRQYFDFSIGNFFGGHTAPPGTYRLYAGYETRGVSLEGFTIAP